MEEEDDDDDNEGVGSTSPNNGDLLSLVCMVPYHNRTGRVHESYPTRALWDHFFTS